MQTFPFSFTEDKPLFSLCHNASVLSRVRKVPPPTDGRDQLLRGLLPARHLGRLGRGGRGSGGQADGRGAHAVYDGEGGHWLGSLLGMDIVQLGAAISRLHIFLN